MITILSIPLGFLFAYSFILAIKSLVCLFRYSYFCNEKNSTPTYSSFYLAIGLICAMMEYILFFLNIRFDNFKFEYIFTYKDQIIFSIFQFFSIFNFFLFCLYNVSIIQKLNKILILSLYLFFSVYLLFIPISISNNVINQMNTLYLFNYFLIQYKIDMNISLNNYFLLMFLTLFTIISFYYIFCTMRGFLVKNKAYFAFFTLLIFLAMSVICLRILPSKILNVAENMIIITFLFTIRIIFYKYTLKDIIKKRLICEVGEE